MRQIVLDTETTGLEPEKGHRLIEIGCVELDNRRPTGRTYHQYINPQRLVDAGAVEVHGIDNDFLSDKPLFADIVDEMLDFLGTAELVIHNAPFDVGFINHELRLWRSTSPGIESRCAILDTLLLARDRHPGQRNSLDALCKRYDVDNTNRTLHGALLDARILTDVYLAMTGGQVALVLADEDNETEQHESSHRPVDRSGLTLVTEAVSEAEKAAHEATLDKIDVACEDKSVWRRVPGG